MTQKKTATTPTRGVQTTRDLTTPEGLDREIDILRELIHKAAAKQSDDLSLGSSSSCSTRSARPLPRWRAC